MVIESTHVQTVIQTGTWSSSLIDIAIGILTLSCLAIGYFLARLVSQGDKLVLAIEGINKFIATQEEKNKLIEKVEANITDLYAKYNSHSTSITALSTASNINHKKGHKLESNN